MSCKNCIHAEVCGLRDQLGEYAEQCEYFFKKIPKPHGRLIDADKAAHSILMMSSHPCGCSIENVKDVVEWLRFVNGDGNNFAFPTIVEAEVSE